VKSINRQDAKSGCLLCAISLIFAIGLVSFTIGTFSARNIISGEYLDIGSNLIKIGIGLLAMTLSLSLAKHEYLPIITGRPLTAFEKNQTDATSPTEK